MVSAAVIPLSKQRSQALIEGGIAAPRLDAAIPPVSGGSVDGERSRDGDVVRRRGVLVQLEDIGPRLHGRRSGRVYVALTLTERRDREPDGHRLGLAGVQRHSGEAD